MEVQATHWDLTTCRDILLLQQEVRLRDMESEKKLLEMEAERAKVQRGHHNGSCLTSFLSSDCQVQGGYEDSIFGNGGAYKLSIESCKSL